MSFRYTVGLNNMGSYQVSGQPWMKTVTGLADGGTEYLTFDNVTKKVRVKNHSTSGKLKIGFADNARRAYNMPDSNGRLDASFTITDEDQFTISFWIKPTITSPATSVTRILQLGSTDATRIQGTGTGGLKFFVANQPVSTGNNLYESEVWAQITVVINQDENKLYVNGVEAATNTTTAPMFNELSIGADATNYDDIYDEMYLYNTPFTQAEVTELYASGGYLDPRDHSQSGNLVSWWAFEDNSFRTYFTTNDTITTINDRIGSNNLTHTTGGGTGAFVNGRQLDTAVNFHSIIIPAGGEVELNVKTKSMFLFADGATQSFDVYASLTGISSERMYELTGPGIDE